MKTQGYQSFFVATVIKNDQFLDGKTGLSEFFCLIQRFEEYRCIGHVSLEIKFLKITLTVEKTVDFSIKKPKK